MREREIFMAAWQRDDPEDRRVYLERACGNDTDLRDRVLALFQAFDRAGSFLLEPAAHPNRPGASSPSRASGVETAEIPDFEGPGAVVGPYKLLQEIGGGGMGTVYMADQDRPVRRRVALKVIKAGMDSRPVIARFEAERQALALMDHPNIARVLDAGTTEPGRPYFVMELVRGVPITTYCDKNHLTPRERLELFIPVCQAIQHAHQKGIIHRDIKPSNVLVAPYDGRPVPKVIDFGIAKATGPRLTEATLFTAFGLVVGTLEYMSPEQAELNQLDIDTRSDIYALGVLLYELLTGTTPLPRKRLEASALLDVLRTIREEEPPRPSNRLDTTEELPAIAANRGMEPGQLSGLVRGELDWIVMKALEKDRNRRYDTASALAADVRRYLADEPVQACPPSAAYRFRKFARRHKAGVLTAASLTLGAMLAIGGLVTAVLVQAARSAEVTAEQEQTKEALNRETQTIEALTKSLESEERTGYFRGIALAERELTAGNVGRAEELLDECPVRLRGWEWHHLKRRPYGPLTFREHSSGVWTMAFSPDGNFIASAGVKLLFGEVLIWDRRTRDVRLRRLAHLGPIEGLAFSPDGKRFATASWDRTVKVWDTATGQELHTLRGHREYVRCVAFSRDGKFLASAGGDHSIFIWDATTYQKVRNLHGHTGGVFAIAFGNGDRVASASADGTVRVWDAATGAEKHVLHGHAGPALAVAFLRDGTRLASGGFDGTARVWDPETGRELVTLAIDTIATTCVAFNPDGTRLAAGSLEKSVRIWDLEARQEAVSLSGQVDTVMAVAFSPDGQQLAAASLDRTVQVWDASPATGSPRAMPLLGHEGAVFGVAVQPASAGQAGRLLVASASQDETVKIWDATTGEVVRTLAGHAGPVARVSFSRDGRRMVSGDFTSVAKVWDTATFHEIRTFRAFAGIVALSPDGQRIAFTAEGAKVHIRDVESGEEVLPPFRSHDVPIVTVAFTPDGRRLATGSWDGSVKLWDVSTGKAAGTFIGGGIIAWLAFSDDGTRLATASWDKAIRIWDTATGEQIQTLLGHQHRVLGVAFSPDGRHLASASQDNTVRVWEVATGKSVAVLHGHIGYVLSVAYSADGRRLVSSGGYRARGDVRIWDTSQWDEKPGGE